MTYLEHSYVDGFCKTAEDFNVDPGTLSALAAFFLPGGLPGYLVARATRNNGGSALVNTLAGATGGGLAMGAVGGGLGALGSHMYNKTSPSWKRKRSVAKDALTAAVLSGILGSVGGGITGSVMNTKKDTKRGKNKGKGDK